MADSARLAFAEALIGNFVWGRRKHAKSLINCPPSRRDGCIPRLIDDDTWAQIQRRTTLEVNRKQTDEQIVVKSNGRHLFLQNDEIEWIEAVGKDLRIHLGANVLVVREPLNSLERRLDPAVFLRVHRSAIVNRTRIREVQPWFKGDYVLILNDGTKLRSGRTYRTVVQALIE